MSNSTLFTRRRLWTLLGLVVVGFGLISWPNYSLRYFETTAARWWSLALLSPPLLLWLGWYVTRPGRGRGEGFGALSFVVIVGYGLLWPALMGGLQLVNAAAGGEPTVVRGTVVKRQHATRRKRRRILQSPLTITVRVAPAGEEVTLAVTDRNEQARLTAGKSFEATLRRGLLGWWFAPKP